MPGAALGEALSWQRSCSFWQIRLEFGVDEDADKAGNGPLGGKLAVVLCWGEGGLVGCGGSSWGGGGGGGCLCL